MKDRSKHSEIIKKCKKKLLGLKAEYEKILKRPIRKIQNSSDVLDVVQLEIDHQNSKYFRERIRNLMPEIQFALQRIDNGTYGKCEVTGRRIEERRLLAVPWTRISINAFD